MCPHIVGSAGGQVGARGRARNVQARQRGALGRGRHLLHHLHVAQVLRAAQVGRVHAGQQDLQVGGRVQASGLRRLGCTRQAGPGHDM